MRIEKRDLPCDYKNFDDYIMRQTKKKRKRRRVRGNNP